jgi:starvation-inducible outer membrane lipoprotein
MAVLVGLVSRKMRLIKTIILLFDCIMILQGCVYPISKDLVDKTDKTITFEMLQADPDMYKGKFVILGGSIAAITGLVQGSLIDIYQTPLDYWGRPIRVNGARGQFLVYTPVFIDANIYALGSEITVAGEIEGTKLKLPGKTEITKYTCPVLVSKELKLWPRTRGPEVPDWFDPLAPMFYPEQ